MRHIARKGTEAFTLIELLVVIAVIAILAAIMFPVMGAAMRASSMATCTSNLKQFAVAFSAYESDWGALPLPGGANQPSGAQIPAWLSSAGPGASAQQGALWMYIRSRINSSGRNQVWSCPMTAPVDKSMLQGGYSPGVGYVMNDYIRAAHPGEGNWSAKTAGYWAGMSSGWCPRPQKVILLYEAVQNRYGFLNRLGSPYYVPADKSNEMFSTLAAYIPQNYHNGRCNFLFLDGHVRSYRPDETWTAACRDGNKDGYSNFTGFKVDPSVRAAYPGCGDTDMWNPRVAGVMYP